MGRCIINIDVTGCHHNGERAIECHDLDLLARKFVSELRSYDHAIHSATFEVTGHTPPAIQDLK